MIPKIVKIIASILLLAYGVYQISETFIGNGIFLIILSILLMVLYFKNEILIFAFLSLRKQNFERTERILKLIKNPKSMLIRKEKEEISMALWIECLLLTVEEFLLEEGRKVEKNYLFLTNHVTRNNF